MLSAACWDKTSDHARFRAAMDALEPAERQEMAGYLISQLGKGRPVPKRPSRRPLPRRTSRRIGRGSERAGKTCSCPMSLMRRQKKLRDLAKVSARMKYYETTRITAAPPIHTSLEAWARLATFDPFRQSSALASWRHAALGKLMTSSRYHLDWLLKTGNRHRRRRASIGRGGMYT